MTVRNLRLAGVLLFAAACAFAASFVLELKPQVSATFFFSDDDPALQTDIQIDRAFPNPPFLVISAVGDPRSPDYRDRVESLTTDLEQAGGIESVRSLVRGPSDPEEARSGPLWSRLLLDRTDSSSRLLVFPEGDFDAAVIARVDSVVAAHRSRLDLATSGVPWVLEHIRLSLGRDLKVFGATTFLLFGALILALFGSWRLVLGTVAVCIAVVACTLGIVDALGLPIGMLTANLGTIVAVLTLSQSVFLVSNWLEEDSHDPGERTRAAVRRTLPPAFWSMASTALGFGSLWWARAEPLRNLGLSGLMGTGVAFAGTFLLLPAVLTSLPTGGRDRTPGPLRRLAGSIARLGPVSAGILGGVFLLLGAGIPRLETDPSLLDYFSANSGIRRGLEEIDRGFGSSPLHVMIADADGSHFDQGKTLDRFDELRRDLEAEESVGTVLCLPLLIRQAEASSFFAKLLPDGFLLRRLESDKHDGIARSFVTEDHEHALIRLYMRETGRERDRAAVTRGIEALVEEAGFVVEAVGGPYLLQDRLSRLVYESTRRGLLLLLAVVGVVVFGLARSAPIGVAALVSIALVPIALLGAIGLMGMPLDVIAAPSVNLTVALGVDAIFHLLATVKREEQERGREGAWNRARGRLARPVLRSTVLLVAGFGVFGLSAFPPTRRFGLSIATGSLLAAPVALVVFPELVTGFRCAARVVRSHLHSGKLQKRTRKPGRKRS